MISRNRGLLQVAIASIGFGFIGVFSKAAFAEAVTVGELLAMRFILATIILGLALLVFNRKVLRIGANQTLLSLALGVLGYAVFATLYLMAIHGLSVALAVLLLYTFPFWTFIINIVLGERLSKAGCLGLVGALAGLVMLLWGELRVESAMAVLCGFGSALSYAIYIVVSDRLQKGVAPLGSGFWVIFGAAIALSIFHNPDWSHIATWGMSQDFPMLGLAVVCTVIPLVLIQAALQHLPSTETAILCMIEPVTASIAAAIFLGEIPRLMHILGGILVLLSLFLVTVKGSKEISQ